MNLNHIITEDANFQVKTQSLPFNKKGRDFVIGDLHGEYDKLMEKMHEVSFNKEVDRLFSVGDLIDRGPKSFECLKLIEEPWFYSVKANHEDLMIHALTYCDKEYMNVWEINGGKWWRSVPLTDLMPYVREAEELPYSIKVGEGEKSFGICHTDPPMNWNDVVNLENRENMLWGREILNHGKPVTIQNIGRVYCGHTPRKEVVIMGNVFFIDTYACWTNGKLTMLEISF